MSGRRRGRLKVFVDRRAVFDGVDFKNAEFRITPVKNAPITDSFAAKAAQIAREMS